ncbi:MAG: MFS transporter [Pseudoalteromonas distincta]|mgnify:FL=1|tara:strand:+ start:4891 stop:6480 length:1590 start_codon:yes stop_codon:yes gene_type:complete
MNQGATWYPLKHRQFRLFWSAGAVINIAIWMQTVGAAWIMAGLTDSAWMVSLVQTAMTLPVFLFGLPGGVIADLVNRKYWLLFTQSVMLTAASILFVLAATGSLSTWMLLSLTFLLGTGSALSMSAWMAVTLTLIPREIVPAAVALNAISTNVARALGPAIGGLLIAVAGQASMFLLIAFCFMGVILFLFGWRPVRVSNVLPPETFLGGMRSGLRYIRHSVSLVSSLKQVFIFTSCASALWALLPLIAKDQLQMEADGYGLLMAALGAGAVIAALNLTRLYRLVALRQLVVVGAVAFAIVTAAVSLTDVVWVVWLLLVIAGIAWMAVNATVATIVQTCAADWVRARVASVYLLMYMGAMAVGGAVWGLIADYLGTTNSLLLAAVSIVLGLWLTRDGVFVLGSEADYRTVSQTDELVVAAEINHSDGPVSVEISYWALDEFQQDFIKCAYAVGQSRRRNGARNWRLYRDLADPNRFVERFIVESWLGYLRQRDRVTQADQNTERQLQRYVISTDVATKRYIHQPNAMDGW